MVIRRNLLKLPQRQGGREKNIWYSKVLCPTSGNYGFRRSPQARRLKLRIARQCAQRWCSPVGLLPKKDSRIDQEDGVPHYPTVLRRERTTSVITKHHQYFRLPTSTVLERFRRRLSLEIKRQRHINDGTRFNKRIKTSVGVIRFHFYPSTVQFPNPGHLSPLFRRVGRRRRSIAFVGFALRLQIKCRKPTSTGIIQTFGNEDDS